MSLVDMCNAICEYVPDREVVALRQLSVDDPLFVIHLCAAIRRHRVRPPRRVTSSLLAYLDEIDPAFERPPSKVRAGSAF